MDTEVPLDDRGRVYHIDASSGDIADHIILVGDPFRVPKVAELFDKGSIRFENTHREIRVATGTYKGVPVSCISTGMGTDNVEIIVNEIHVLKDFNAKEKRWEPKGQRKVALIRVGTCGSPCDVKVGTLAITRHSIGLDNTCQYYTSDEDIVDNGVSRLKKIINETELGRVGVYATKASPLVTAALEAAAQKHAPSRPHVAGITASASGFYANQGRRVGYLGEHMRFPNLLATLRGVELAIPGVAPERLINLEMETSALCFLSHCLGYLAGSVCVVVAKRTAKDSEFLAGPDQPPAVQDAIRVGLEALISL